MKVNRKVVWITGASSGIGEALVNEFAQRNCKVILSSRRVAELERVQRATGLDSSNSFILPLDLAEYKDMPKKADQAINAFGKVDILINNGGISQRSLIVETGMEVYERIMDVDYLGTVAITKAILPHFVKNSEGMVGVVSSLMGKFASPLRSGYCGAKHALHGFFDALRHEHEKDNVQVTIFCPGFIKTDISMNAVTADGSKQAKMDDGQAGGISAEECAKQMIKALEKGKMEVGIGKKEIYALYLKRFFPRLLHRIVRKSSVT